MLPKDSEFLTLYFLYILLFLGMYFLYNRSTISQRKIILLSLVLFVALNCLLYLPKENFEGGGALAVLFYSALIWFFGVVLYSSLALYNFLKQSEE